MGPVARRGPRRAHTDARLGHPADGGSTHWLRATITVPEAWRGQPVLLAMDWQGGGQSSLEAILYLDGPALAGIDEFHRAVLLPAEAHTGEHSVPLRCYVPFKQPFGGLTLRLRDDTIFHLGHAICSLTEAVETYRDSDPARHLLLEQINAAYNTLDLREGWWSERFAESARAAFALLTKDEGRRTKEEADRHPSFVLRRLSSDRRCSRPATPTWTPPGSGRSGARARRWRTRWPRRCT